MTRKRSTLSKIIGDTSNWSWHWRSLACVVFCIICFVDLVVMPIYCEVMFNRMDNERIVLLARSMKDPVAQIETLKVLKADRRWTPLTSETFFLAFGAILGVSALPGNRRTGGGGEIIVQPGNQPQPPGVE